MQHTWTLAIALTVASNLLPCVALAANEPEAFQGLATPTLRTAGSGTEWSRTQNPLWQPIFGYFLGDNGTVWDYRLTMKLSELGPLRAAGKLTMSRQDKSGTYFSKGTATLISPCHILTSAHAMYDQGHGSMPWTKIVFLAGDRQQQVIARRIPNQSGRPAASRNSCLKDYEVLRLDQCVGDEFGYLPIWKVSPLNITRDFVVSVGYPLGNEDAKGINVDPMCLIPGKVLNKKTRLCGQT